jgi:carboxylesterase
MHVDPPLHIRPLAHRYERTRRHPHAVVILVHGFADSPYSLRGLANALYEEGYSVIVPRLPGHGARLEDFRASRWRDWRLCLTQELERAKRSGKPIAIVARSFGGVLALHEVARQETVHALVLLATPAVVKWRRFLAACAAILGIAAKNVKKPWRKASERIERFEEGRYESMPLPTIREFFRAIGRLTPSVLAKIHVPVLVLHGSDDRVSDPSSAQWLFRRIGSATKRLRMIEDVGHTSRDLNTHPMVVQEILAFLRSSLADT